MCEAYVRDFFGPGFTLERACYFSALAYHLTPQKPRVVERHRTYIRALESAEVEVNLARFKSRPLRCDSCGRHFTRHEEKETDVAIAIQLFELAPRPLWSDRPGSLGCRDSGFTRTAALSSDPPSSPARPAGSWPAVQRP